MIEYVGINLLLHIFSASALSCVHAGRLSIQPTLDHGSLVQLIVLKLMLDYLGVAVVGCRLSRKAAKVHQ